jgi:hypothetical protein
LFFFFYYSYRLPIQFVLAGGLLFVALLSFITGILYAVVAISGQPVAGAIFGFFTMVVAAGAGVFCWLAGGGGTA